MIMAAATPAWSLLRHAASSSPIDHVAADHRAFPVISAAGEPVSRYVTLQVRWSAPVAPPLCPGLISRPVRGPVSGPVPVISGLHSRMPAEIQDDGRDADGRSGAAGMRASPTRPR